MVAAAAACRVTRRGPVPGGAEPQGRVDRAPVRRAPGSRGIGGRSRSQDRGRSAERRGRGKARARIGAEVLLHVRELRDRRWQPVCPRRRPDRRRAPRAGIQPALHLRRRGCRQDPPRPGDRQLRHALRPGTRGPLRDGGNLHERVHGSPPALGSAGLQKTLPPGGRPAARGRPVPGRQEQDRRGVLLHGRFHHQRWRPTGALRGSPALRDAIPSQPAQGKVRKRAPGRHRRTRPGPEARGPAQALRTRRG